MLLCIQTKSVRMQFRIENVSILIRHFKASALVQLFPMNFAAFFFTAIRVEAPLFCHTSV